LAHPVVTVFNPKSIAFDSVEDYYCAKFQQAVRVATQYALPLFYPWAPKRLARRRADAM